MQKNKTVSFIIDKLWSHVTDQNKHPALSECPLFNAFKYFSFSDFTQPVVPALC